MSTNNIILIKPFGQPNSLQPFPIFLRWGGDNLDCPLHGLQGRSGLPVAG
jgi:hypothetical protein